MKFNTPSKTAVINIISVGLLQGISFFTSPLFMRLLGPDQYGVFSVYSSWVNVFSCFISLKVGTGLGTGKYQFEDYYQFRSSILLLGTAIATAISTVCMVFIKPISNWMGYSMTISIIMIAAAFGNFVTSFSQSCFIYEKKPQVNFIFSLIMSLSSVALSLVLIYSGADDKRYIGRILGTALPHIIGAFVLWFVIFMKKPSLIHKDYAKFALIMGVPTVFHLLSHNVLSQSDRIMMQKMSVPDTDVGLYSAFYTLSFVLSIIMTALNNSWTPFYYDDLNEKAFERINKKCKNYMEVFTVLVCSFVLLVREVGLIFAGEKYAQGIGIIPLFVLTVYIMFMYQFPVNFEIFHKKTTMIAIGTSCCAVLNIILNFFMIKAWGYYGAAIATVLSYLALFFAHFTIVTHLKNAKFHLNLLFYVPGVIAVLVVCAMYYVLKDYYIIRWVLGIALGVFELVRLIKRRSIF